MKKVYCKNCKWFKTSKLVMEDGIQVPNCYLEDYIEKEDKSVCSNYQRKWWKFWVK